MNGCSKALCPMRVGCADNCKLTKKECPYFTAISGYQEMVDKIKAEVAREIFEEIEFDIHQLMFDREETRAIAIEGIIANLKKKYAGK